jgi:tryptophan synthase alpha chain
MPFVVGGHPAPGATAPLLAAIERAGAPIVEIGFPFSDPIADGPVVSQAMHRALAAGATAERLLEEVAGVRASVGLGLVAMVSVSIVHRLGGPGAFVGRATDAGFDGFIFPDLTLEESGPYRAACAAHSASCSLLVAPTSPPARAAAIASACSGFVYLLARSGITGERQDMPSIEQPVRALRASTQLPIAAGFGISRAEHVRAVLAHADAAIVGSALVRRIESAPDSPAEAGGAFVAELLS